MAAETHIWDLWYPGAGSQGISFARGRLAATGRLLVHAAPDPLAVDVVDDDGTLVARGRDLESTLESPMAMLIRDGNEIRREDLWPSGSEVGLPLILAGGEVGILKTWWHADDHSEWRWSIELYNHR